MGGTRPGARRSIARVQRARMLGARCGDRRTHMGMEGAAADAQEPVVIFEITWRIGPEPPNVVASRIRLIHHPASQTGQNRRNVVLGMPSSCERIVRLKARQHAENIGGHTLLPAFSFGVTT